MERSPDPHEQDVPSRPIEEPMSGAEEQEIDRILADSFPASDPPPWTLGVASMATKHKRTTVSFTRR